jgi:hypothetical protein
MELVPNARFSQEAIDFVSAVSKDIGPRNGRTKFGKTGSGHKDINVASTWNPPNWSAFVGYDTPLCSIPSAYPHIPLVFFRAGDADG